MLKKYTAILCMTIAYAILLGHSIIPHHHHQDHEHELTEHHHSSHPQADHHHHDNDADSEDLSHLFAHFIHSTEGFVLTTNPSISSTFSKQLLSIIAVLPGNFLLSIFDIPPLLDRPPAEHLHYSFFYTCTFGLRAPPAL